MLQLGNSECCSLSVMRLVVDSILTKLNSIEYYTVGYVDDLSIIITGKDKETIVKVTQSALKQIRKMVFNQLDC